MTSMLHFLYYYIIYSYATVKEAPGVQIHHTRQRRPTNSHVHGRIHVYDVLGDSGIERRAVEAAETVDRPCVCVKCIER